MRLTRLSRRNKQPMPDTSELEGLFIRLYFDHHIKLQLAEELRAAGYDVLTTQEAGMETATDTAQLTFAAQENRSILTYNIRDFAPLHEQWLSAGRDHAGIIVSQQLGNRQYALLRQRMLRLLNEVSAEQIQNNLFHLE